MIPMNRNPKRNKETYLNGDVLFRKYYEMGDAKSITRLRKFAISQGMVSSTGKEPTDMGVWKAMWRWASLKENAYKAWEIYSNRDGQECNFDEWVEVMKKTIRAAWQHPTEAKYNRFLKENGWA